MKATILIVLLILSFEVMSQDEKNNFLPCHSKEEYGGKWPQYYQTGASYEGGLYAIKKYYNDVYKSTENQKDTGYFTVRFMINCLGEIGNFEILQCDLDFKSTNFTEELQMQIISVLKNLKDWEPGIDGSGTKIDSQKFLTFVMDNGRIKDIVPK